MTDERAPTRKGRLDFLDNRLDAGDAAPSAAARVFENKDLFLTPGLFGRDRGARLAERYQGVLVPDEAVAHRPGPPHRLRVAEDGSVAAKPVRPGPRIDGYRVIREGLKGDESSSSRAFAHPPGREGHPQMTELPRSRERNGPTRSCRGRPRCALPISSSTGRSSQRSCRSSSCSSAASPTSTCRSPSIREIAPPTIVVRASYPGAECRDGRADRGDARSSRRSTASRTCSTCPPTRPSDGACR